jgi:hypothetical protein
MKKSLPALAVCLFGVAALLNSGCEWTGGGGTESFNTSQGAGINVNFSGVYEGRLGGGKAVSTSSGGTITRFIITQNGNACEVVDNQGSKYKGSFGSPGLVSEPEPDGTFPEGAEVAQSQVSWAGHDNVAAKDIEFVGVIHIVTITDIQGETTTESHTDESSSENNNSSSSETASGGEVTTTRVHNDGTNTTTVTTTTIDGDPVDIVITTTIVVDNSTGREISHTTTREEVESSDSSNSSSTSDSVTTTKTTTFQIDESGGYWRLEGTWIEKGGVVAQVDATSAGGVTIRTTVTETGGGGGEEGQ